MNLTAKLLYVLLFAFALGACGQSGPLYVPGDPSEIQTTPTTPEADEEGDENGEDDESQ